MNMTKNILLCAYACQPNRGSEPGVGWETANHLARKDKETNYYVITRENNKLTIENEVYPNNLTFIYYDLPSLFMKIKRKGNFVRTYYYFWMLGASIKLWKNRNNYKIIHHITFVNDWLPSLFILLKNKKNYFIWGPIGSHSKVDVKFLNSKKEKTTEQLRILLQKTFRTFDLFFLLCKRKSDIIIGINTNVKNKLRLSKNQSKKFQNIPAIAMNNSPLVLSNISKINNSKLQVISVGRLMYIKNFQLTLRSFARFLSLIPKEEREKIELIVIGEGKLKKQLINLSKVLKLEKHIFFKGQMSQKDVMSYYEKANVFLFPTMESAGFVVLEAMSYGLPLVALDYGGPKEFVKKNIECQLVSSEIDIKEIERQLSIKILEFYNCFEKQEKVGQENFDTVVENFSWEHKTNFLLKTYNSLG